MTNEEKIIFLTSNFNSFQIEVSNKRYKNQPRVELAGINLYLHKYTGNDLRFIFRIYPPTILRSLNWYTRIIKLTLVAESGRLILPIIEYGGSGWDDFIQCDRSYDLEELDIRIKQPTVVHNERVIIV